VTRLAPLDAPQYQPFPLLPHTEACHLRRQLPIAITQFRVEPKCTIPLHNHAGYNGVMLGLSGEFRVRNFQPVGDALPERGSFQVRETIDQFVTVGRIATLARARDNLHEVTAGTDGAEALDLFTIFPGQAGRSGFFNLGQQAVDAGRRIHTAAWRD